MVGRTAAIVLLMLLTPMAAGASGDPFLCHYHYNVRVVLSYSGPGVPSGATVTSSEIPFGCAF